MKIECQECKQVVDAQQRHTYTDCLIYKNKHNIDCLKAFKISLNRFANEQQGETRK